MAKLYILPFDHRSSFSRDILGIENPDKDSKELIKRFKNIIFEGLLLSMTTRKDKSSFAVLVDEEYGKEVLERAKENKVKICIPVEKSGEELLKLEYGKKFGEHIKKYDPQYVKVLIRYNPGNIKGNKKQLSTLSEVSAFCRENGYKTIIELLVPPTADDLVNCKDKETYDKTLRIEKTCLSIREIKACCKPDIWKLEGFDKKEWVEIIKETKGSKIIMLGRGEDSTKVRKWLKDASAFKEIIGFAIGRTIFLDAIKDFHSGKISEDKAIKTISRKFLSFVDNWEKYGEKDI
jgi:myo-inositol catabolism protein IolC